MVKRQVTVRLSVPRPGDSRTQPTSAFAVGDGLELHSEQEVEFIAAHVRCRLTKSLLSNI